MESQLIATIKTFLEIGAIIIAFIIGVWRIRQGIDNRVSGLERQILESQIERKAILEDLEGIRRDLRKEFSGNSNGLREAVNRMSTMIERVDERTDVLSVELAELRGRFDERTGRRA